MGLERCKFTVETKEDEFKTLEKTHEELTKELKRQNSELEREKDQIISTYQIQIEGLMSKIQNIQDNATRQEDNKNKLRNDYEITLKRLEQSNEVLEKTKG